MRKNLAALLVMILAIEVHAWDYDQAIKDLPCKPDCTLEEEMAYAEWLSDLQLGELSELGMIDEDQQSFTVADDYVEILSKENLYHRLVSISRSGRNVPTKALWHLAQVYTDNPSHIKNKRYLVLIDFQKPSSVERMYVFDLSRNTMTSHLVAHGVNSGTLYAKKFSNISGSRQSSLGFMVTGSTYYGDNGKSLNLHGLEARNSKVFQRRIVIHKSNYVSHAYVRRHGMVGQSWGCPAVPNSDHYLVDQLASGVLVYKYY